MAAAAGPQSYSALRSGAEHTHFVDGAELTGTRIEGEVGYQLAAPSRAAAPVTATVVGVGVEGGIGLEWFEGSPGGRSCRTP